MVRMVHRDNESYSPPSGGAFGRLCIDNPGEVAVERGSILSEKGLVVSQPRRDSRILC